MQILFLRRRYNDVFENHIFPLSVELHGFFKYKEKSKSFDFPWGSRIIFGYCDNEKDVLQYQGKAFDCIIVEEATQFTPFMIQCLQESLRPSGFMKSYLNWTPRMYYTCNPGGVGHAYIKRLFIDQEYERKERPENYSFVPSTVYENAFIMDNDPTYVETLENLPEQRRKAMLLGDWDVYEGQFFTGWQNVSDHYLDRKHTHVVEDFTPPVHWKRYRVMDWGYAKPFSIGWYAVNEDDQAFRYREWYGCTGEPDVGLRMTPEEVAEEVKKYEAEFEYGKGVEYIHGIADPAIFHTDTGKSISESFADKGVYFDPADNSRLTGWTQMRERMKFDHEGHSMLYFCRNNKHAVRTIPSLIHDETKVEDLDTTQEDHCLIGDTQVLTAYGKRSIKDLVGTEGYALSHDGQFHKYYDCRLTQENADVFKVEFEDGSSVTATLNHRFMLSDGRWVRLDELKPNDDVLEVRNHEQSKSNQRN